ncbi:MAG TPA: fibronectin type III-like domain-contianing protein [Candidatus Kryptobacter bacterium]|nr:fibronectin type III-like domain-contianing protein [Candidatus Kryptobacter bacterium]
MKIARRANKYIVTLKLKNTCGSAGVEVPQLCVCDPYPALQKPVKELKRFDLISLKPGHPSTVASLVDDITLAHFDPCNGKWTPVPGKYVILIGSSGRDINLHDAIRSKSRIAGRRGKCRISPDYACPWTTGQ